jgi:hypothetical protein
MANQPTRWRSSVIAIGIEQKVANLELKLADALDRIARLEHQRPAGSADWPHLEEHQLHPLDASAVNAASAESFPTAPTVSDSATRQLVARDSQEMAEALRLCREVFPGCSTEVEVLCDPSEPDWPWYLLIVHWQGEVRDSIDRQLLWQEKTTAAFPHHFDAFRIFVDLQ